MFPFDDVIMIDNALGNWKCEFRKTLIKNHENIHVYEICEYLVELKLYLIYGNEVDYQFHILW